MTTANDFAKATIAIEQLSDAIKPPDGASYREARELARFHLRSAAKETRKIAESLAAKEKA